MIDIDEILEKYYTVFKGEHILTEPSAKQAIKEIVTQTLELAAENAKLKPHYLPLAAIYGYDVDKQSILSQIENIKF